MKKLIGIFADLIIGSVKFPQTCITTKLHAFSLCKEHKTISGSVGCQKISVSWHERFQAARLSLKELLELQVPTSTASKTKWLMNERATYLSKRRTSEFLFSRAQTQNPAAAGAKITFSLWSRPLGTISLDSRGERFRVDDTGEWFCVCAFGCSARIAAFIKPAASQTNENKHVCKNSTTHCGNVVGAHYKSSLAHL